MKVTLAHSDGIMSVYEQRRSAGQEGHLPLREQVADLQSVVSVLYLTLKDLIEFVEEGLSR